MRTLFITLALVGFVGCGDDGKTTTPIDAPVVTPPIDAAPVLPALDCPTYCTTILANCTGTNAQYPDMAHCTAACASFPVGTSKVTDTSGNTLGCRIYHAGTPAKTTPATHCPHAGPGGDLISAAGAGTCGDACTSFCNLEVKACGTTAAPINGITPVYADTAACMTACAGFDKTHLYATNSVGDSLACRLYHATNAAISATNATTHCPHTGPNPLTAPNPCIGTPSP